MPVSSNQVAQMMAGQHQQAIAGANQYAQQMQSPIAALNQAQLGGSNISMSAAGAAPAVLSAGFGAVNMAQNVGMMAGAMGFAPRALDPFSSMWHAGRMGYGGGVAMGGAGAAGAIGNVALLGGAYLAMGQAASFATQNMIQGAQQQTHMMNAIQQGYGGSGMQMGAMGVGLSAQLANVGLGMSDAAVGTSLAGQINPGSMTNLISQGMGSGQFRGVRSVNEFRKRLASYTAEAARMADMLKVSIDQAAAQMDQISGQFGIGGTAATGMIGGMAGQVRTTGLSIEAQMAGAQMGAQVFQGLGMSRAGGASYGLGLHQRIGAGIQSGALSERLIGDLGGISSVSAGLTRGGIRGLSGRHGLRILGAAMGSDGTLDVGVASRIASGMMSRQEINRLYHRNVQGIGGRRNLLAARGELMGQFMSQFGPEGVMGGLESMFEGRAGSGFLMQQAMGLGRSELGALGDMGASRDMIRQKIAGAARDGIRSAGAKLSIPEALQRGLDQALGPIRNKFQQYGRDINQAIASTIEDISRDLSGRGPASVGGDISMGVSAAAIGNVDLARRMGYGTYTPHQTIGGSQTTLGRAIGAVTPGIISHLQQGGSLSDAAGLPLYGMGTPSGLGALGAIGGITGVAGMGAMGGAAGRGMLGASGWLAARAGAAEGFMGLAGRGMAGGMIGMARAGTWMGGHMLGAAGAASRMAGAAMSPLGMALGATIGIGMHAADLGGQFGASSGIGGRSAASLMLAEQAGLISPEYTNMNSGSAGYLQGQGYAPVMGMTRGESSVMRDAAEWYGLTSRGGGGVKQGFVNVGDLNNLDEFLTSGIGDTGGLEERTGMTRGALRTAAQGIMNEARRNIGADVEDTSDYNYFQGLQKAVSGAARGTRLAGLNMKDTLRLAYIGGGDPMIDKMKNGIGIAKFLTMAKSDAEDMMSKFDARGFDSFKRAFQKNRYKIKDIAGAMRAGVPVRELNEKVKEDHFDSTIDKVHQLTKDYKSGLDTSASVALARGDAGAMKALREHVIQGFSKSNPEEMALANKMVQSEEFKMYGQEGMAFKARYESTRGAAEVIKRRKDSARAYNDYREKVGSGLSGLLAGTNIRGASELGGHLETMMQEYAAGKADPAADAASRAKIREMLGKMDPDEAHDIASSLQAYADRSDSPAIQEFAMMARSNSNFRGRYKKELRRPGTTENKLKTLAGMFGNTKNVTKALGLRGTKEERAFIRSHMKEKGDLPEFAKVQLLAARRADLAASGLSAEHAAKEMQNLSRFLDAGGVEKEDMAAATGIAETSARIGASRRRPGGAAGGGAHQNYTAAVNDFSRKLGEASEAINKFNNSIGAGKNGQNNPDTQNTGADKPWYNFWD